ncbi:hypothetical protein N2152v2_007862 [Parachlorella kessleri]
MADATSAAQEAYRGGQYERALELYNQAAEADPSNPAVFLGRCRVHDKLENHMDALADATHALELDSKLADGYKEKGRALFNLEEFESAKDAFEHASALEPQKRIHKEWVKMCQVKLGEELPQEPSQVRRDEPAAEAAASPGRISPAAAAAAAAAPKEREVTSITVDDAEYSKYWKAPVAPAAAPEVQPAKYRHQWFQMPDKVEVNVLAKGLKKEQVSVSIEPERLRVAINSPDGQEDYSLDVALHAAVVPARSKYEVLSTKVEVKLAKAEPKQWASLDTAGQQLAVGAAVPVAAPPPAPYAGKKVDWDKVEAEVKKEEKEEQPEGDQAVMKFFRELYGNADEDMKRAMIKSYQESGEKLPGERQPYVMARCPVGKEDFRPSECPVCLTEINKRRRWVELRCKHGLCKTCLWRLVRAQGEGAMCPLCRNQLCAYLSEIRAADSTTSGAARAAEPPTPVVGFPVVLAGVEPQPVTEPPAGVRETTEGTGGATSTSTTDICGSRC